MEEWNHGRGHDSLTEVRTARAWGVPVSTFRGTTAPGEKWTGTDRTLAMALTIYEAGLCGGCGQPLALTHSSDDHKGHGYAVQTYECTSCSELESVSDETKKADVPGTKRYTVLDD